MVAQDKQLPILAHPNEELIEAARKAAVRIAGRSSQADRERRVPVENIQDLHEAGLLTVVIPRNLGGTEADLVTQVAVYELIGGACASTAWVMGNHSVFCTRAMGMMGEDSHFLIRDVVENGALISHAAIPGGDTKRSSGGFIASGRWPFVSGSDLSTWMFLSTMVEDENRFMIIPTSQPGLTIEPTWQAMAARGSMTNDVLLDKVFVPEGRAPIARRPAPHEPWLPDGPAAVSYTHLTLPTNREV